MYLNNLMKIQCYPNPNGHVEGSIFFYMYICIENPK
jgi:hypothetical protein